MSLLYFGFNKNDYTPNQIAASCKKRDIDFTFINVEEIAIQNGKIIHKDNILNLEKYTGAIVRSQGKIIDTVHTKKRELSYFLIKILRSHNIPTINSHFHSQNPFSDKFSQAQLFENNNISTIPTLYVGDLARLGNEIALPWSYPIIIKEIEGSFGLSVYKLESLSDMQKFAVENPHGEFIAQKFIPNHCDYRIIVCGKKSLGILKRSSKGGWKHNFSQGASVSSHQDTAMESFAQEVAQKIKSDYVGIDVITDENGAYNVIEINLSANFKGFEKALKSVNVSDAIINTLLLKKIY